MFKWVPEAIAEFRILVGEHAFAAGCLFTLMVIWILRRYIFKSAESALIAHRKDLEKQIRELKRSLKIEQARVRQCHDELTECRIQVGDNTKKGERL